MDNIINRTPKKSIISIHKEPNKTTTTTTATTTRITTKAKHFNTGEEPEIFLEKKFYEGYGALTTVENLNSCTNYQSSEKVQNKCFYCWFE